MIEWDEKYSVTSEALNGEHKKLFSLINDYNSAIGTGRENELCRSILDELLDYTKYHFSNEEKVLKQNSYSQLDSHKEAHSILIDRLDDLRKKAARSMEISRETLGLLEEWICQHILMADRHYALELGSSLAE